MEGFVCLFLVFIPLCILALIFLIFHRHWDQNRPREDEWRELAERLGLTFSKLSGGERMVDGYYRGYEVGVYSIREAHLSYGALPLDLIGLFIPDRATCIVVVLEYPLEGVELSLSSEDRINKAGKLLFGEDVLIGDDTFDNRFLIRSKPEELAKHAFSSYEIRRRILETTHPVFTFDGKELKWMTAGVEKDVDHIHHVLDLLCDLANAIRRA